MNYPNFDYLQTWAEINLDNLKFNLKQVKRIISRGVKVLATVKANAYGHGIGKVSRFLEDKVDILGVASVDEAHLLIKEGIKKDILIMGSTLPKGLNLAVEDNIASTVADEDSALSLNYIAKAKGKIARIHVKIDTGMGRIGFWHKEAIEAIKRIDKLPHIQIDGLFTHLSSAESNRKFTLMQLRRFNELIEDVKGFNIEIPYYHAANSMATLFYKESHFNLIRPGLILYGVYPEIRLKRKLDVKPVLSLKSKVIYLKEVEAGRSISYGREYITDKRRKIATVPIGYADGYTYLLTHKARVLIKGRFAPVIGRICMDQIMVDTSKIGNVAVGDEVILIGRKGKNRITTEELAKLAGTIPYEILCGISQRVKRLYV
jgi:alanine racemase